MQLMALLAVGLKHSTYIIIGHLRVISAIRAGIDRAPPHVDQPCPLIIGDGVVQSNSQFILDDAATHLWFCRGWGELAFFPDAEQRS